MPVERSNLKLVLPTADQVLIAAANFFTIILLARQLSVEDFGTFTLVFTLLHFANSMQSGLITQPHNVLGATRRDVDYATYTSSTAIGQLVLGLLTIMLALTGWAVCEALGSSAAPLLLAAAPAAFAWQVQEFLRRVLYTEQRFGAALACDAIGYGGQIIAISLLWHFRVLSGVYALYAIAAAFFAASAIGFIPLRKSFARRIDLAHLRENWHFGKWIAGGSIISQWLSAQMLVYLAAAAIGAMAAGVLRAIHTIFGPARILAQMLSITLPTRLARALADEGDEAFRSQWKQSIVLAAPALGIYCLLAAVFAQPLLTVIFGERYREYAPVLSLYAISAWLTYLCIFLSAVLRAKRSTRAIFIGEVVYLMVVPIGAALIPFCGIYGVVIGLIAGDITVLIYLWSCYCKSMPALNRVEPEPLAQGAVA